MGLGNALNCSDVNLEQIFDADLMIEPLALNNCAFFKNSMSSFGTASVRGIMMLIKTNRNIIHLHCVLQERDGTLSSDPGKTFLACNF